MNLKERIVINDDHFHVLSIDEKRKLYYGCTFFKDSKNTIPKMEEIQYWDSKNRKEIQSKSTGCFLHFEERIDNEVVERCRLYMPNRKGAYLNVKLDKPHRYGRNACRITIKWENCPGEAIHGDYVKLKDRYGNAYPFLTDCIEPMENTGDELMDQYIFTVPNNMHMNDFEVSFDDDVREKYKIITVIK